MKAFVSPDSSDRNTASEQSRLHFEAKAKISPSSIGQHSHHLTSDKLLSPQTNSIRQKTLDTSSARNHSKLQFRQDLDIKQKSNIDSGVRKLSGESSIKVPQDDSSPPRAKLEAVVTLSKGRTGEATDVHMIPSPPSSAKPTESRPGSAQRFRKMVLECRDSS
jgi:hypothetical protein